MSTWERAAALVEEWSEGYGKSFLERPVDRDDLIQLVESAMESAIQAFKDSLTDEQINDIADSCIAAMPEGIRGFCKTWSWQQFARELLDQCGIRFLTGEQR